MTDALERIAILSRMTGRQMEVRRTRLVSVEALYASQKYVVARLIDGTELFVDGIAVADEVTGCEGGYSISLVKLKEVLSRHCPYSFRQTHRACVVNMCEIAAIRRVNGDDRPVWKPGEMRSSVVELISLRGNAYPVSRRYAAQIGHLFRAGCGLNEMEVDA